MNGGVIHDVAGEVLLGQKAERFVQISSNKAVKTKAIPRKVSEINALVSASQEIESEREFVVDTSKERHMDLLVERQIVYDVTFIALHRCHPFLEDI